MVWLGYLERCYKHRDGLMSLEIKQPCKQPVFIQSLSSLTDHSKCSQPLVLLFAHQQQPSGAVWGYVSCQRTLGHVDCMGQGWNHWPSNKWAAASFILGSCNFKHLMLNNIHCLLLNNMLIEKNHLGIRGPTALVLIQPISRTSQLSLTSVWTSSLDW